MSDVNSRISFNNRNYDVTPIAGFSANSVSQRFADSLKKASEDNNISQEELNELKSISDTGTQSEKEIVLSLSTAGTALLDNNANDDVQPVQITFGTPTTSRRTPAAPTETGATGERNATQPQTFAMNIPNPNPEFSSNFNISPELYNYYNSSIAGSRNPSISYSEFQQLQEIASRSSNPDDIQFVRSLADLAITKIDQRGGDKKITVAGPDGRNVSIQIDTREPRSTGESGTPRTSFRGVLNNILNSAGRAAVGAAGQAAVNYYNRLNPGNPVFNPVRPFTFEPPPPTGFRMTANSGVDANNKYRVNVGLQYTTPLIGNTTLSVQAGYGASVFTVPSVFTYGRDPNAAYQGRGGFNATASVNFGDNARISYSTQTGFQAAANFNLNKESFLAVGYNYQNQGQGRGNGVFIGIGRRF